MHESLLHPPPVLSLSSFDYSSRAHGYLLPPHIQKQTENQMVSAERVLNYCRVPPEARLDSEPGNKPPEDWPSAGNIEVPQMLDGT